MCSKAKASSSLVTQQQPLKSTGHTMNPNATVHHYLCSEPNATWMLVIQQQPLRPEAGVIWVVALGSHVCGVAHHVQRDDIQQGMASCMQTIPEGQPSIPNPLPCSPGDTNVGCLHCTSTMLGLHYMG